MDYIVDYPIWNQEAKTIATVQIQRGDILDVQIFHETYKSSGWTPTFDINEIRRLFDE